MDGSDPIIVLGVALSIVGVLGIAIGTYWLYASIRGITPRSFTDRTKRMAPGRQRVVAAWLVVADAAVAAVGLAIALNPAVRDVIGSLLGVTARR